jgi:AAHS family 4-hydroxybenzoate transporter-like MFS transporter
MASEIDVASLIEQRPLGRYVLRMMAVALLAQLLEGFDLVNLAFVAPALVREWGLDRSAMGPVFSAGLLGLVLGAVLFGPLGDRIGRKRAVILSVLAFGVCSVATVAAGNLHQMLVLRLLTGIGIGGVMPTTMALVAEYAPRHLRGTLTTVMSCGLTVGAALGGVVALRLVPDHGWQSVFWIGGLGPLILVPLLMRYLPESIRFLALNPNNADRIAGILRQIDPALIFPATTRFVLHETGLRRGRFRDLFAPGWSLATMLLWLTVFCNITISTFYNQWTPIMLSSFGLPVGAAVQAAIFYQVGAVGGAFLQGWAADRYGFFRVLAIAYLLSAVCTLLTISFGPQAGLVIALIALQGICGGAAQNCVNGLSGTFYPTAIRATGSGWALAVGRCGGVLGPALGGAMLAAHWSIPSIFYAAMVPSILACISITMMGVAATQSGIAPARARLVSGRLGAG